MDELQPVVEAVDMDSAPRAPGVEYYGVAPWLNRRSAAGHEHPAGGDGQRDH